MQNLYRRAWNNWCSPSPTEQNMGTCETSLRDPSHVLALQNLSPYGQLSRSPSSPNHKSPSPNLLFASSQQKTTTTMGLLKSARLLRLLRVVRRLDQYSQYAPAVICLLMCAFTLVAHWMACCWYSIGEGERTKREYGWLNQLSRDVNETYRVGLLWYYISILAPISLNCLAEKKLLTRKSFWEDLIFGYLPNFEMFAFYIA